MFVDFGVVLFFLFVAHSPVSSVFCVVALLFLLCVLLLALFVFVMSCNQVLFSFVLICICVQFCCQAYFLFDFLFTLCALRATIF